MKDLIVNILLLCILSVSLSLNVVNGWRLEEISHRRPLAGVQVGTSFNQAPVIDLVGQKQTLAFNDNRNTLLYVFSPTCVWCERNRQNFESLVKAKHSDYRIIAIALHTTDLATYVKRAEPTFEIYYVGSSTERSELGLLFTPELVILDTHGVVKKKWQGAWRDDNASDIERAFNVKLPGLAEVSE